MASITTQALKTVLSSDNFLRIITLLIGYFLGPYFNFVATNQNILTAGALVLFAPQILRTAAIPFLQLSKIPIPQVYSQIMSAAVVGGGSLFVLYSKSNLLPDVVVKGIMALLNTVFNSAAQWWDNGVLVLKYCMGLLNIPISDDLSATIGKLMQQFMEFQIVANASRVLSDIRSGGFSETLIGGRPANLGWSQARNPFTQAQWSSLKTDLVAENTSTSVLFVMMTNVINNLRDFGNSSSIVNAISSFRMQLVSQIDQLLAMNPLSESFQKLSSTLSTQLDVSSIWLDEKIPVIGKILAAAKVWMQSCVDTIQPIISKYVGAAQLEPICYCVAFIVAAAGASWLTKRIYDAQNKNATPISLADECLVEFANTNRTSVKLAQSIFFALTQKRDGGTVNWRQLSIQIETGLNAIQAKCSDLSLELQSRWINLNQIFKQQDAGESSIAFLKFLVDYSKELKKASDVLTATGNHRIILFVDKINKNVSLEVLTMFELLLNFIDKNEQIYKSRRPQINPAIFALGQAAEATKNVIGAAQVL